MRVVGLRRFLFPKILFSSSQIHLSSAAPSTSTIDQGEIGRFAALADSWWSEEGPFKALRSMNRLRVPWIRDTLLQVHRQLGRSEPSAGSPLAGFRILDVGCGAGFLTEPLARLGANVVGIDPTVENIEVAKEHASRWKEDLGYQERLVYYCKTVEDLVETGEDRAQESETVQDPIEEPKLSHQLYDAVIASEVLEHVINRESFVDNCLRLVKPGGGCVFFTTINRTEASRLLAIIMAENVLRIVPQGMHEWEKFTPPEDLQFLVEKKGDCNVRLVHGMWYNPCMNRWSWARNTYVNYALCGVKK